MISFSKYRIIAAALAGVFALFNIGLPIVLYACPMMQQSPYAAACCVDQPVQGGVSIGVSTDRSCCKTLYAAGRNTTEFLQNKVHVTLLDYSCAQLLHTHVLHTPACSFTVHRLYSSSPPLPQDIPIFTSSLLI